MALVLCITNIFLWHVFSSCFAEFTAVAFQHPPATLPSSSQFIPSAKIHFYNVCIIPSLPPSPATASICTNWKAVSGLGDRQIFKASYQLCRKGRWDMKTCFPSKKNGVCSAKENVLSKKIKLFSREWLLYSPTHAPRVSHMSKEGGGGKVEDLPVRQRHTSGPSPGGIQACQRGEQPGLLQKKKHTSAV